MKRLRRDVRRKAYLYYNPPRKKPGITYIPSLYISKKWSPPQYYPKVENCLDNFERHYRRHCLSHRKRLSLSNLTSPENGLQLKPFAKTTLSLSPKLTKTWVAPHFPDLSTILRELKSI